MGCCTFCSVSCIREEVHSWTPKEELALSICLILGGTRVWLSLLLSTPNTVGAETKERFMGGAPAKTWLWKLQKHDVRRSKKEAESLEQTKLWAWPPLQWEQWKQMWLTDNKWSSRSTWYSTVTTAAPASSAHVCSQNLSKSKCAVSSLRQNTTQMFPERSNEQTNSLHGKTMCLCHKALMTDVRFINGFLFWDWWSRHEVCESELQGREILFNVQISHLFWLYFTNSMN